MNKHAKPEHVIQFRANNGEVVGILYWSDTKNKLMFDGEIDKSARSFLTYMCGECHKCGEKIKPDFYEEPILVEFINGTINND